MASFLKDVISIGFSKGAIIIFGLISSIITARYLGPEGNGTIAGLLVYPSLFMSLGSLGIRQSTTYFIGKNIYAEESIKTAITQIWVLSTIISIASCFILMVYFSNSGSNLFWVFLALVPIPFNLFNIYNSGIFLGKNDISTFNKINWIPSFIGLLAMAIFLMMLNYGVSGALIAKISGPIFMFVLLLFRNKFIHSFSVQYNWTVIKNLLSLGLIYALSLFIINLNYKVDIVLLDQLSTAYEMGIYSKGSGITQYLWQIPMLFSTIVFARSAVAKNDLAFSLKVAQLLRLSLIFIGLGSIFLLLFSKFIIIGMYGEEFSGSISVLKYLLPGVLILTVYKVMNMDLAGKGKPWISMWAMVPALLINVVANWYYIPRYGANGAALSSTISYTIAGILFLYFYSKAANIPIIEILRYRKTDFDPILNLIRAYKK